MVCLMTVFLVALKAITNEVYIHWNIWFLIEGVCKISNVLLSVTLVQEKEIMILFVAYQKHFSLSQLDVHKDRFRQREEKMSRDFWRLIIAISAFYSVSFVLFVAVPEDKNARFWET